MDNKKNRFSDTRRGFMQDFNNIRELLRLIYIYGCYTGKDFSERGIFTIVNSNADESDPGKAHVISTRKRIDEMNRIRYFLPGKFLIRKKTKEGNVLSIHYYIYAQNDDVLLSTYQTRTITEGQVLTYFLALQGLKLECDELYGDDYRSYSDRNEFFDLSILCTDLLDWIGESAAPESRLSTWVNEADAMLKTKQGADGQRNRFREKMYGISDLVDAGFLSAEKKEDHDDTAFRVNYALKPSVISYLNDERMTETEQRLFQYMDFLARSCRIPAPYYLLAERLRRNLEDNYADFIRPKIYYRHNYLYGSLDDNVKISLLQAIHSHQTCQISYKSERRVFGQDINYSAKKKTVIPVRLLHNSLSGQQYLILYDPENGIADSLRADLIINVKPDKTLSQAEFRTAEAKCTIFDAAWCTSPFRLDEKHHVIIRFHFDPKDPDEPRLIEEADKGELRKRGQGAYEYHLDVSDPNEMVPWISSFGHRAELIPTDAATENLKQVMLGKWARLRKKYGTL